MDNTKLARINELARKSKAEGLTSAERQEQALLRSEYLEAVRRNLKGQLDNIDIVNKDGSVENLGKKYEERYGKKRKLESWFLQGGKRRRQRACRKRAGRSVTGSFGWRHFRRQTAFIPTWTIMVKYVCVL